MKKSIALGNFDGLHRGHLAVLGEAAQEGCEKLILQFSDPPASAPKLITAAQKKELLDRLGFTPAEISFARVRDLTPAEFFEEFLIKKLGVSLISCGNNFTFGRNRSGDVSVLRGLCEKYGTDLRVAEDCVYGGGLVSSTRIREAVSEGRITEANEMLGRPFAYDFTVVGGDKRGRLIGFPTINQFFGDGFTVPASGVYKSVVRIDGRDYAGVTNIGARPTFGSDSVRSETHILSFDGDLYGKNPLTQLIAYIRPVIKFGSAEELKAQILKDTETAGQL